MRLRQFGLCKNLETHLLDYYVHCHLAISLAVGLLGFRSEEVWERAECSDSCQFADPVTAVTVIDRNLGHSGDLRSLALEDLVWVLEGSELVVEIVAGQSPIDR